MKTTLEKQKMIIMLNVLLDEMNIPAKCRTEVIFCLMSLYSGNSIVPFKAYDFNAYLISTDARQLSTPEGSSDKYYVLYNWSDEESAAYHQKKLEWDKLFAKYTDPTGVNSIERDKVRNFIEAFHQFAPKYYGKVKSSDSCTEEDARIFNFKFKRKIRQHRTTKIEEPCYAIIEHTGTCALKGKVRTYSDSKRSCKLKGSSGVEVAIKALWRIGDPPLKGVPQLLPDKTWSYQQFSKAIFDLVFDSEDSGAIVQICCRWFILGKSLFSGPWSETIQIRVL